ncbi:NAD(P)-dependent oxidoreductase [Amycolatopsis nigrescens]|uniref:NAD(P)-dependent oxidoreductase n=1 Tax=Amycolatopsis nigrescens TaxID=381445 RepID=UPI00036F6105|nr:NAD(P)-binding oxidoreductase [Amycolatopsis nigrescens]
MKVLLLGATGGIGRLTLPRLLADGHRVTTLSRRQGAVRSGPAVSPVIGDITDPEVVASVVAGQDCVISTVGVPTSSTGRTVSTGIRHTIAAMGAAGVSRLIAVSGNGLGINGGPFVDRLLTPTVLRHVKADAELQESRIVASGLDWTIVRPFRLAGSAPRGRGYHVAGSFPRTVFGRWTHRDDVAKYLVAQLSEHAHRGVLWIASGGR